jgi:biopolymer transport protein ExbD
MDLSGKTVIVTGRGSSPVRLPRAIAVKARAKTPPKVNVKAKVKVKVKVKVRVKERVKEKVTEKGKEKVKVKANSPTAMVPTTSTVRCRTPRSR